MSEASDALAHAQEVADYQAIGVRCREALLAFTNAAQTVMPWTADKATKPKRADFKAWVDHFCSVSMAGATHEERRHLFKTLLSSAWRFSNWLTHTKASRWFDAEAAASTTEHAISLGTSAVIRHMRGVPETCPACGSHKLSPQRGFGPEFPETEWERPTCDKCEWVGDAVPVFSTPDAYRSEGEDRPPPDGDCIVPTVPLRTLLKPRKS
jgi:hypothetical protein